MIASRRKRVAALDCGTNSLRLLVVDLDLATREQVEVDRRTSIVRLGQDVDRTGIFAAEALERTFTSLDTYVGLIERSGVSAVRLVATSAARDVSNRDEFVHGVVARLGVEPDIISGDEEARLAYDGATRGLARRGDIAKPLLVVDIGGGSTELVSRIGDFGRVRGESLEIGSVRLTERHLTSDPPTAVEIDAVRRDIESALDTVSFSLDDVGTIVGVAGTVTTMAAMVLGLSVYDRAQVDLAWLEREALLSAVDEILAMTVAERKALGFMDPGRADVIGGGALVLAGVVERVGLPGLICSEHDILDGIAWSMA